MTESRILGALPKIDEFLLNPQIRNVSGAVPGTSQNTDVENQKTTGDHSQNDPHPELDCYIYQSLIQMTCTQKRPPTNNFHNVNSNNNV